MPGLIIQNQPMTETAANYQGYIKYLTVPPERHSDPAFSGTDIPAINALEDPSRREIYTKMQGCSENFAFPDRPAAEKHWTFRMTAINTMRRMNSQGLDLIDFTYFDLNPAADKGVKTPGTLWRKGPKVDPGSGINMQHRLRTTEGATRSLAIAQLV
jgi:hypothetical protein